MGVWVVLTNVGYGCSEFDSIWEDKEQALRYMAETYDDRADVKVEWHRIEGN